MLFVKDCMEYKTDYKSNEEFYLSKISDYITDAVGEISHESKMANAVKCSICKGCTHCKHCGGGGGLHHKQLSDKIED